MSLLAPLALLGLLTVPVIFLLHLLRNRRQQLAISSLHLWQGLEQKGRGDMFRNIPCSLMLLMQLLIAIALAVGLARPALSFLLDTPQQTIIILDMTTSMTAASPQEISRFELARRVIQSRLAEMRGEDSLALVSLEAHPRLLMSGGADQKEQMDLALAELQPGGTGLDLPAALILANGLLDGDPSRQHEIIILTDGNYPVEPERLPPLQAPLSWQIFPARSPNNQALLNLSARPLPGGRYRLFVRIINYGAEPVARTLRLIVDANIADESPVRLESQQETARVWTVPAETEQVAVEIVEPDVLLRDNRAELLLTANIGARVLLLSDSPDDLARALSVQPGLELVQDGLERLAAYDPATFDLIVFEGLPSELDAWPRGNLLVVNPPPGHALLPVETTLVRNLRPSPESASPGLIEGIELSGVYFNRLVVADPLPDWARVDLAAVPMESADEEEPTEYPAIWHGATGNSRLAVWGFDLAASNLPARPALPLLMANSLAALLTPAPPPVVPAGEPVAIDPAFSVETPAGRRLLPSRQEQDWLLRQTGQPGLYKIYNSGNRLVAGFAVQAGSALESNLAVQFQPNLHRGREQVEAEVEYYELWPWLVGLALFVATVEGWLAWRK